jgi:aspartate/methionine/tyrosine aminotransferase
MASSETPGAVDDRSDRFLSRKVLDARSSQGASKVWAEVTALARLPGVLDLGQGWPDFGANDVARNAASDALVRSPDPRANQYSPITGAPELLTAISRYYRATGSADVGTPLVTTSATEALYVALQTLCDPGDVVVYLEPFFPWYAGHCRVLGLTARTVRLDRDEATNAFVLDVAKLGKALEGAKVFVYNSPHNPTGLVLDRAQVEAVAKLCVAEDVAVIADEVYERCTFADARFARIADAPGMAERTLTVGTASKLLCLSGWRVGWVCGPAALVSAVSSSRAYVTYCAPTPLQIGVAAALDAISDEADAATRARALKAALEADAAESARGGGGGGGGGGGAEIGETGASSARRAAAKQAAEGAVTPDETAKTMAENVAILAEALEACGAKPCPPAGGYFLVADVAPLEMSAGAFVDALAKEARVAAVPLGVFYQGDVGDRGEEDTLVRFAVCKKRETIEKCAAAIREFAPRR